MGAGELLDLLLRRALRKRVLGVGLRRASPGAQPVLEGGRVIGMSPSFVGTEPAIFTLNGVAYEAVVDMQRADYSLYAALDATQKTAADAGDVPDELLTGAGKDGVVPPAMDLSASK